MKKDSGRMKTEIPSSAYMGVIRAKGQCLASLRVLCASVCTFLLLCSLFFFAFILPPSSLLLAALFNGVSISIPSLLSQEVNEDAPAEV